MTGKTSVRACEISSSEASSRSAVADERKTAPMRVRTNIKAGLVREPTKHPAKVTVPDLK
jgi:hypothetical protein